jgi:starvation-inducible DNA-binding protein
MTTGSLPSSLYAAARLYSGEQLRHLLIATIDLSLVVEHAHWNVHGRGSDVLHRLFDDLSDALAGHRDRLAQRVAELGVAPDGRLGTVAAESRLPELGNGPLPPGDAAAAVSGRLDCVAGLARQHLSDLGPSDAATRHVVLDLVHLIDRHRDMLQHTGVLA